jgi:chloramphenicol O-acetyltransferase type A
MYSLIDIDTWNRKEHFNFYKQFSQPFFGLTMDIECTNCYLNSKQGGPTFFQSYLYNVIHSINQVDELKYRIINDELRHYHKINVSSTVFREDKTFGFSFIEYDKEFTHFSKNVDVEISRVKDTAGLFTSELTGRPDVIHFSALPWVSFTSIDHAFHIGSDDTCPKVSVGRIKEMHGKYFLPISLHAHHACADGYHASLFFDLLQNRMNE